MAHAETLSCHGQRQMSAHDSKDKPIITVAYSSQEAVWDSDRERSGSYRSTTKSNELICHWKRVRQGNRGGTATDMEIHLNETQHGEVLTALSFVIKTALIHLFEVRNIRTGLIQNGNMDLSQPVAGCCHLVLNE